MSTSTRPLQVETDIGFGYLKLPDSDQGPHALAGEIIGVRLAEWLGLATLDIGTIDAPTLELPDNGGTTNAGHGLISREVEGQPWGGGDEQLAAVENIDDVAGLVVLDTWVRNHDRYSKRCGATKRNLNNVFFGHEGVGEPSRLRLIAMDFTNAIRCERGQITRAVCGVAYSKQAEMFGLFPEFRPYVTEERIRAWREKLASFDRGIATRVVGEIPRAWALDDDVRARVVEFLVDRAAFLSEHLPTIWAEEVGKQTTDEAQQLAATEGPERSQPNYEENGEK